MLLQKFTQIEEIQDASNFIKRLYVRFKNGLGISIIEANGGFELMIRAGINDNFDVSTLIDESDGGEDGIVFCQNWESLEYYIRKIGNAIIVCDK